jgi:hypothetical protein
MDDDAQRRLRPAASNTSKRTWGRRWTRARQNASASVSESKMVQVGASPAGTPSTSHGSPPSTIEANTAT